MIAALLIGLALFTGAPSPDPGNLNNDAELDASQVEDMRPSKAISLVPCANEGDKGPCYWDAQSRGNKQGSDFISLPRGVGGATTIYVELTGKNAVTTDGVTYNLVR